MLAVVVLVLALVAAIGWRVLSKRSDESGALELAQALDAFEFLERDHGFTCTRNEYSYQSFGNIVLDYERGPLRLRIVRDRSQWLGDFSMPSRSDSVFDLFFLVEYVGGKAAVDQLVRDEHRSLANFTACLHDYIKEMTSHFEPDRFPALITADDQERVRRIKLLRG